MKKIISLLCILALVFTITPMLNSGKANAESQPVPTYIGDRDVEIQLGASYDFNFKILRYYTDEKLVVNIYYGKDTDGNSPVYSSEVNYISSSSIVNDTTVTWDTSDTAPGTYTVEYYMVYNDYSSTTEKTFNIKVVSDKYGTFVESEDGLTKSTAYSAQFGTNYIKAWTTANSDASCLNKITLSNSGKVTVNLTKPRKDNGVAGDISVAVFSSSGEAVAGINLDGEESIEDEFSYSVYLGKGTYYFDIKPEFSVSSGLATTVYSFSFNKKSYCEAEPNNTSSKATKLVKDKMHEALFGEYSYTESVDEDDYFKFKVTAGEKITLKITNYPAIEDSTAIVELKLPDGSESSINYGDMVADSNDVGKYTFYPEKSGTCVLHLYNYSGAIIPYKVGFTASRKPPAAKLVSVKNKKGVIMDITWTCDDYSKIKGFQTYVALNKKFTKKLMKFKTSSKYGGLYLYKSNGIRKGKTYYVKVRTYRKLNGKTYYSDWSKVKKVKIKK